VNKDSRHKTSVPQRGRIVNGWEEFVPRFVDFVKVRCDSPLDSPAALA
jgi:hypothetical protein